MALLRELRKEVGSHYYAALNEWTYPASMAELIAVLHTEAYLNSKRDPKKQPTIISLPRPWGSSAAKAETVTEEERDALLASLERRSAFRDR